MFSTASLFAQNLFQKSDMKEGLKLTRTMSIPQGWEASHSMKFVQKSEESYIPASQSWRTAEGSIFVTKVPLDNEQETIDDVIDFEVKTYTTFGEVKVENSRTIIVDNDKSIAIVKKYYGASDAPFQAIAYIPERNSVTLVSFFADNETFFKQHLNSFETFVKSYTYNIEILPVALDNTYY
jgi:hypothetical protein